MVLRFDYEEFGEVEVVKKKLKRHLKTTGLFGVCGLIAVVFIILLYMMPEVILISIGVGFLTVLYKLAYDVWN